VTIQLTAGQYYPIRVEYYENMQDGAAVQLFWQTASMSKQIVPASAFFHSIP
jgi:hypothetical protein